MAKPAIEMPAISFDLCRRNAMLEKQGGHPPKFLKTGTTIVGLIYKASSGHPNLVHSTTLCQWPPPLMDRGRSPLQKGAQWGVNGAFLHNLICTDATSVDANSCRAAAHAGVTGCVVCYDDSYDDCDYGSLPETLTAMKFMVEEESFTASNNFFCLLERCISEGNLAAGRDTHSLIITCGFESHAFLASHLIRMFAFFHSLPEANQVFSKLSEPSVFSWNAIISAHVKLGQNEQGIDLYYQMLKSSMEPNGHIFVEVLKAFSNMKELQEGKAVHACIIESGLESDVYIGNTLVDMYANSTTLEDACRVFNRLPMRDVVTWNTLIAAHSQYGHVQEALRLFEQLTLDRIEPNRVTFMSILKANSITVGVEPATQIHAYVIEHGLETGVFVGNSLIDMYVKCECLNDAYILSERLPKRDLVTFNTLIAGYARDGHGQEALRLLRSMMREGIGPDCFTFVSILKPCLGIASIDQVMWAYNYIIQGRFESDIYVASALVNTLTKCGRLEDAHRVFDRSTKQNIVIWSALIDGYIQSGCNKKAFELFQQMKCQHGLNPDSVTYASILKACSGMETLHHGRWIHAHILEDGIESDQFISSSLIDTYARCESLEDAHVVFERLHHCNIVVWSALITGFTQQGQGHKALRLFEQMQQQEGLEPDEVTFVCVLNACSNVAALGKGRQMHALVIEIGLELDAFIGSSLIDMYANCGNFEDACITFDLLPVRTTVTWNAIITASAQHNKYLLADQYFKGMTKAGLKPQEVTFLCLLSACSRVGLVDKGCFYLRSMSMDFGIAPALEHLNSMVDILGCKRQWKEAEDLLETIPFQCNIVGWMSLLSSCRTHASVDLGRRCFNYVAAVDSGKAAGYVLMSNIYARAGMWDNAKKIDELRQYANGWKKPGKAFIEIDNHVHEFSVGEKAHSQSNEIHAKLKRLTVQMRQEGYKPYVDLVLGPSSAQEKEDALCGHCEKLAIAFGLISTPQGTTIRIAKNLRVCVDCHSAAKTISKIELREIIIADSYCIHKFQDGACSCRNYS